METLEYGMDITFNSPLDGRIIFKFLKCDSYILVM